MFHLALLSVGFSQQDSCVHLAMLSGYRHIDIHHRGPRAEEWEPSGGLNSGYVFSKIIVICQEKFIVFVATNFGEKRPLCLIFHGIAGFSPWKIRSSVGFLGGASDPPGLRQLLDDAPRLGLTVREVRMASPYGEAQYTDAFRVMTQDQAQAVLVSDQAEHFPNRRLIVALAATHRLPAMYPFLEYIEVGGLMAYGVALQDLYRRMAGYVDRILKGAKPGDLPFEQPATFELVINLKTAQALGLTIPPSLLFQADKVIR